MIAPLQAGTPIEMFDELTRKIDQLSMNSERLQSILRVVNLGIMLHGPGTEMLVCNETALKMLDVDESHLLNKNIEDFKGNTVRYIRTKFELVDATSTKGFPGIWWGHYEYEIPSVNCDAIVELDFNSYQKRFEVRLVEVRPALVSEPETLKPRFSNRQKPLKVIDFRQASTDSMLTELGSIIWIKECPRNCRQAILTDSKLALNYQATNLVTSREILQQLVGVAKYLAHNGENIELERLKLKMGIGDRALRLGLNALVEIGFQISVENQTSLVTIGLLQHQNFHEVDLYSLVTVQKFFAAIEEEKFNRNYFLQVPVYAIESSLSG